MVMSRELVAALNDELPGCYVLNSAVNINLLHMSVTATIVGALDICDDEDPGRLDEISCRFSKPQQCDSLVLNLPQRWVVCDPNFKPKCRSMRLFPGSLMMTFFRYWGRVESAQILFGSAHSAESSVRLLVKFSNLE